MSLQITTLPVKWTVTRLKALKADGQKFATLTAYDYTTARLLDEAGIEVLLVGDSLAMTVLGYPDTLSVTMDEMLHHTRAVSRAAQRALVMADMPFGSYHISLEETLRNGVRFMQEGHADTVKLEGATPTTLTAIERLVGMGIPVVGHLGLTPQAVKTLGGFKLQGKSIADAERLLHDAMSLEAAGVCAIVLEMIPAELAATVTRALGIPTIGIGAGNQCDSQVLVIDDFLGRYEALSPRFVRRYAPLAEITRDAATRYRDDVIAGTFPNETETYRFKPDEARDWQALHPIDSLTAV